MKRYQLFLAIFAGLLVGSCMDSNIYKMTRPAVTRQYREYLENENVRKQVDGDWMNNNQKLAEDGFAKIRHPYGDQSLKEMGIEKVKEHKFSNQ